MSAVPASLLAPRAPQVNLIPPEVASRRAAGKTRGMTVLVLVGFALILGAASFAAQTQKASAEAALAVEQERGASLQAEIDKYAEVPLVQKELDNAKSARLFAGATEVRWQNLVRRMGWVMPSGVKFATLSFANTSVAGVNAPAAGPFTTAGIGTVTYTGASDQYPDLPSLERAIDSVEGLTDARIPEVTRVVTDGVVSYTFSGTATVTAQALDMRFTDAWFVAHKREVASNYIDALVSAFEAQVAVAQANVSAGVPGADADLTEAQGSRDAVLDTRETFTALSDALKTAQADLATATTAQTSGEKGAEAAVAASQVKVDALGAGLDQLSAAAVTAGDASIAVYVDSTRVTAAEALVKVKRTQLAGAEAALAGATTKRAALQADVDYYTTLVSEAEGVLTKEEDALASAVDAALSSWDALVEATSAAKTVLDTADVIVVTKPTGTPTPQPSVSPTPGASPAPSTTKGSGD